VRYKVSNLLKKEKGFTLIEIVLVLAIAGLLLVIVFLAVSGAQKSRRDTQRKNDLSRVAAQVESYASNHAGDYPANGAAFNTQLTGTYALSNGKDPLTAAVYTYTGIVTPSGTTSAGILYTLGAAGVTACDGTAMTGARTFKLEMGLEQGQGCVDNK
jgi:prepilin-type N-terminal cleavage/methylation domain-containing protein